MEMVNAKIKSTYLGFEGHGILTATLNLDYGNSQQSFGGYGLYGETRNDKSCNYAGFFIQRILKTVGVDEWGDLSGKYIRVMLDRNMIDGIAHIVEDRWFHPREEFIKFEADFGRKNIQT